MGLVRILSSRLPSYASRSQYVQGLYDPLVKPIEDTLRKHREDRTPSEDLIIDLAKQVETLPELPAQGYRMRFEWLHPKIVHRCHIPYETGEFEEAVFSAMTVVEEEVRKKTSSKLTLAPSAMPFISSMQSGAYSFTGLTNFRAIVSIAFLSRQHEARPVPGE